MIRSRAKKSTASKMIMRKGAKRSPPPHSAKPGGPASNASKKGTPSGIGIARASTTPEKVNLISAGIFALKNKPSQSQSSADLMLEQNGTDFDLIEINVMKETGFQGSKHNQSHSQQQQRKSNATDADTVVTKKSIVSYGGNSKEILTNSARNNAKNSVQLGGEMKVKKKKSRAGRAINALKTQSSALATLSSNKEKKVTKTLAIVLIVFLVCW